MATNPIHHPHVNHHGHSHGEKRSAENDPDDEPVAKKSIFKKMQDFWSPTSNYEDVSAQDSGSAAGQDLAAGQYSAPVYPPLPSDPTERQIEMARRIDEQFSRRADQAAEARLLDPKRRLNWNPDIGPLDEAFTAARTQFRKLMKTNSVLSVLDDYFEEFQIIATRGPREDGALLKKQKQDTVEYKKLFGSEGRFHGVPDNLVTKMAMLHFGLPIEPFTLNNILRCSLDEDENDPIDEEGPPPLYQRVKYAEKPLKFLDEYNRRGHGYPIMRSEE
jgi:hypothetical protein